MRSNCKLSSLECIDDTAAQHQKSPPAGFSRNRQDVDNGVGFCRSLVRLLVQQSSPWYYRNKERAQTISFVSLITSLLAATRQNLHATAPIFDVSPPLRTPYKL
jgi:hypothetical protein